ncbi:DUF58 domain-containing protein [Phormidium pseudopriestleyi FRX01]|uniref:DUF58 domain-containing protein n=1 Tax=Phormidium pseudopriestleyi FRX01 TaxID=1759528 RepID=A0ABS3FUA0_9CYAN|nr:DUF58 domain-containing protein [Phormidium pseudopriestleyi]MBO0350417.1 DUF58 domain-containing protein [Phormidium pseudopriestleyi FRX01]
MIPSRLLYLLLGLGIVIAIFIAILFNPTVSIFITLTFDCIVLILGFIDSQRLRNYRVNVTRSPLGKLSIGRDNPVVLTVEARKKLAVIRIGDRYPMAFEVSAPHLQTTVAANTTQELTYTVKPSKRGEYEWGDIQVRQLGSWGLAWLDWTIPAAVKVPVYPDLVGLRSLTIRLALQSTGTMRQRMRRLGNGTEFAELREYGMGDDTRLIDWKATARRHRPLVRVLEPEREQTLLILLDRGRLMTAQVQGMQRFDWGLNATLSLVLAGLNRGDRVGVAVFDRDIHTWIPPAQGQHQMPHLIERLTPLQPVLLEPDYMGAVTRVVSQQTRRALVVMITDIVDATASAELLGALQRLTPRYLPFCVTLRDPQVDEIAHTSTNEIDTTYSRAVALNLLSQRQLVFANLKQKGVLVLDAPANLISDQVVDSYLQLKARNLL